MVGPNFSSDSKRICLFWRKRRKVLNIGYWITCTEGHATRSKLILGGQTTAEGYDRSVSPTNSLLKHGVYFLTVSRSIKMAGFIGSLVVTVSCCSSGIAKRPKTFEFRSYGIIGFLGAISFMQTTFLILLFTSTRTWRVSTNLYFFLNNITKVFKNLSGYNIHSCNLPFSILSKSTHLTSKCFRDSSTFFSVGGLWLE